MIKITPLLLCLAACFCCLNPALAKDDDALWPWASQNPVQPPKLKPYSLPKFNTDSPEFRDSIPALAKAPRVDADQLYQQIVHCYPAKSLWNIDINLRGAVNTGSVLNLDGTSIGRNYVGIVMQMPLYSVTEIERQRDREYKRRTDTAKLLANFIASIANRNQAVRELGLYSSLEGRSRIRVQQGIAEATEQIRYLEKVSKAQTALIKSETDIMQARLTLVGACRPEQADQMNQFLTSVAQLPRADPRREPVQADVPDLNSGTVPGQPR